MKEKLQITGGVACRDNALYVLTNSGSSDEDDRIVWSGGLSGGSVLFTERAEIADLVSIISLRDSLGAIGQAAAMSGEGEVFFFSETDSGRDQIPGAGYVHAGAKKAGRMTVLKQVGNELFAFGYGGQAYRFEPEAGWSDLGVPPDRLDRQTSLVFFTVARFGSMLCFAGTRSRKFRKTREFELAGDAGDSALRARLFLQSRVPDTAALWVYDEGWRDLEIDYPGTIVEIVPSVGAPKYFFTTTGTIMVSPQLEEFGTAFSFSRRKSFWDIKEMEEKTLLLFDGALSEWDGSMRAFSPQIPPAAERYLNVSVFGDRLFAFEESAILWLGPDGWTSIDYAFG